jgi:DNA-binding CsgD family transcriptional regulator
VCHASSLRDPDGGAGSTALVIEPAQPSAIAPIAVEAFELSAREQEIIGLIARGASTSKIADELILSPHTVRDHVKGIFSKVGVSSRGELVARLYADFYAPVHAGADR